ELSSLTVSLSKLSTEVREVGNLVRGRQILGSAEPKIKFDPQLPDKSITESALRKAIEEGRIDLYLQPIVSLPQRKVRYYEALPRPKGNDGDLVAAADFLGQ